MITKIDLRPYRHKPDTWEADITMLVQGQEVRRRQADDEKFLAAARDADLKLYTVILLADDAGMRHGEIIALRKEDIRFGDGPTGSIVVSWSSYNGRINPAANGVLRGLRA